MLENIFWVLIVLIALATLTETLWNIVERTKNKRLNRKEAYNGTLLEDTKQPLLFDRLGEKKERKKWLAKGGLAAKKASPKTIKPTTKKGKK